MKQLQLVSYEYPNTLKLRIKNVNYTFESSEFWCRKFINCYDKGARFNALNWFKRVAKVKEKENGRATK